MTFLFMTLVRILFIISTRFLTSSSLFCVLLDLFAFHALYYYIPIGGLLKWNSTLRTYLWHIFFFFINSPFAGVIIINTLFGRE